MSILGKIEDVFKEALTAVEHEVDKVEETLGFKAEPETTAPEVAPIADPVAATPVATNPAEPVIIDTAVTTNPECKGK